MAVDRAIELRDAGDGHQDAGDFDRINARLLEGFGPLCAALGGEAAPLLADAGLTCPEGKDVPSRLTYRQLVDVLLAASHALDCPDFGMRLARAQAGTDTYGPLGQIMQNSRTLGEALDYVISRAGLHSPAARITKHPLTGSSATVFSHEIIVGQFASQEQAIEYVLLAGHLGAAALTGRRAHARTVMLRHRPVSPITAYRRHFGCKVLFDQPLDGLIFTKEDLESIVIGQDPRLHAKLIAAVEASFAPQDPPIHAAARSALLRLLHLGMATNDQLALDLGLHTRTLHRRLAQSGTTFQKIKDEVRCELARYYLTHPDLSLSWISGRLGFAEQAAFTQFCQRRFGMAPTPLRGQIVGDVPSVV
jgi:AraC-like DNA-binding protein